MEPWSSSLSQTLTALESDGASGVLTLMAEGWSRTFPVSHGRLVLPALGDAGEDVQAVLYGHGFEATDAAAARVAAIDRLGSSIAEAIATDATTFAFEPSDPVGGDSIPTSTAVRDARRRIAEAERLAIQVPNDAAVPDRVRGGTATTHLSRFLGTCHAAVDGSRSLTQLAEDLHVDVTTVRRAVFRLSVLGLVRFDRAVPAPPQPAAHTGVGGNDWASDSLAEAVEEPEPWVGYAEADPDSVRPARPPAASGSTTPTADQTGTTVPASARRTAPGSREPVAPNRQRPLDESERRESLRQASAWLADIDHVDRVPNVEPEPADEPVEAEADEDADGADDFATSMPQHEDVSDFLRELSQLSQDD